MLRRPLIALAILAALVSTGASLRAQFTWLPNAASGAFSPGGNWVGGVGPSAGAALRFEAATGVTTISLGDAYTADSLSFKDTDYTLTTPNGNVLTIGAGGLLVKNRATNLNLPVTFSANQSWFVDTGSTLTVGGVISGAFRLTKTGNGELILTGENTYSGGTTVSAGTLTIGNGGTTGAINGNITNNATVVSNRSDTISYDGVVSGSGNVVKNGAGTLTLTAANTYAGTTSITAGKLVLGAVNALPTTTQLNLTNSAILDVLNNQTVAGFFGTSSATSSLQIATGVTFTVAMPVANETTVFAGGVSGGGIFAVSGAGNDVVKLTGSVTNTGGTLIGSGATLIIGSGGTVTGPITTTGTLTFGSGGAQTFSNVISGSGGISATSGTTTLSAANTYSGPTTITGGKLVVTNTTGSGTGTGTVTVGTGGTLGGTGIITGPLVLNSGGTVSPGASPGTLSAGATTFAGGANFKFEINNATGVVSTNWDLLSISGALTITATDRNPFTLNLVSLTSSNTAGLLTNFNSANSYSWQFVSTTGGITGFSAGAFQYNTNSSDGTFQNPLGTGYFFVSQTGNNLFLNFTPVPEPSTYALLALGLGVIVVLSRRQRS